MAALLRYGLPEIEEEDGDTTSSDDSDSDSSEDELDAELPKSPAFGNWVTLGKRRIRTSAINYNGISFLHCFPLIAY